MTNKSQFVERYNRGEFGNSSPSWDTIKSFLKEFAGEWPSDKNLFHLRSKITGGPTRYNLAYLDIRNIYEIMPQEKRDKEWYVSCMAPSRKTLIQGEIQRSINHYDLTYSWIKKPMREALKEQTLHLSGIQVPYLLKGYMDHNSYEWLQELLDLYPDHIVEFSTYSTQWGTVPNFNTVFWEVRKY